MTVSGEPESGSAAGEVSGEPRGRVLKGGWFTFAFILALTLFGYIDRQMLTLVAAPLSQELQLSDGELGIVLGLGFAIFSVVAVYPISWAADRFDRRLVLAACIVLWSLGTAACGLATTYAQLLLATIAVAAGETALDTIGLAVIPELFTGRKRILANSLYYFFGYLGKSIGMMLGGFAVSRLDELHSTLPLFLQPWSSWRLAFFLVSCPAPLFVFATFFARLRGPHDENPEPIDPAARDTIVTLLRRHRSAYAIIFLALSAYLFSFGGFLSWLPTITTRLFDATAAENGLGMGIANLAGMFGGVTIGVLLMRRLIVRMGASASVKVAWMVGLAGVPFLALYPFISSTLQAYVLLGVLMMSGTAIGSLVATILQDLAPRELRTRMMAVYVIVSSLVSGGAPSAVGWLSTAFGGTPQTLLAALMVISIPSWLLFVILFRLAERPFARLIGSLSRNP